MHPLHLERRTCASPLPGRIFIRFVFNWPSASSTLCFFFFSRIKRMSRLCDERKSREEITILREIERERCACPDHRGFWLTTKILVVNVRRRRERWVLRTCEWVAPLLPPPWSPGLKLEQPPPSISPFSLRPTEVLHHPFVCNSLSFKFPSYTNPTSRVSFSFFLSLLHCSFTFFHARPTFRKYVSLGLPIVGGIWSLKRLLIYIFIVHWNFYLF